METGPDMRAVLAFLRGEYGPFETYNIRQWFAFCKKLGACELLTCSIPTLARLAPKPVVRQLLEARRVHEAVMLRRLDALGRFADVASCEHLRFAVIKGMASSTELYGNAFARQSGDVDILVAADDIPKADYAARQAGWVQPAEAFRARRALNTGRGADAALQGMQAPYPLRSNPFLPHITNYFYRHNCGQVDSLEVHDRFHGLDAVQAGVLLADPHRIELGGRRYATLSRPAQALLSLLSLHEDAEGVRANTVRLGDFGLKACVDVARWLDVLDADELGALGELARALGCERLVTAALGACCALLPASAQSARAVAEPRASVWSVPYEQRILDPNAAVAAGVRDVLAVVAAALAKGHPAAVFSDSGKHYLPACHSNVPSGFSFRLHQGEGSALLSWTAPAALAHQQDDVAFQAVLLGTGKDGSPAAVRVDASCLDGERTAALGEVEAGSVDAHVGRVRSGTSLRVYEVPDGSGGLKVEVAVEAGALPGGKLRVLPSAHLRTYASLFAVAAGWTLVDVAEEALGA